MALSYTQLMDYLSFRAGQQQIPLSGTFELTARCNLNCKMCYIHRKEQDVCARRQELTTQEWIKLAQAAQERGMLLLLLTGGEPFVREDFWEIYSKCKSMGISVSVNTNGTLLTARSVHRLKKDPPARVNLTLYGTSCETYEHVCGDAEAYDRAMDAIRTLQREGIPVKLNYSVTPYNRGDFADACRLAAEQNIPLQAATYMFPPVRLCGCTEALIQRLSPQEAARAAFDYDCWRFSGEEMQRRCLQMLKKKLYTPKTDEPVPMSCRAGSSAFWISWKGQMQLCGMMDQPGEEVLPETFDAVWEQMRKARRQIFLPTACSCCEDRVFCECCPASCYGENQTYDRIPEYLCEKMAAYKEMAGLYLQQHVKK